MSSKKLLWLLPLFAASCSNSDIDREYLTKTAQSSSDTSTTASPGAAAAATAPLNSPERKIKRTADFHCKVQNVFASVTRLEKLVKATGGIVEESRIDNGGNETKTSYYKPDSLKQTQTYTTSAFLTLKVPARQLDSIINAIPGLTSFIDSRTLKQSDVTYQYMANELKNMSGETNYTGSEIKLAKKSKEVIEVQQYETDNREQKIDREIENMQTDDDVAYATVTVAFSQAEQVFVQTIVNPEYLTRTPLMTRCRVALNSGMDILSGIIVCVISIWPLLLALAAGWIAYRKLHSRPVIMLNNKK